MKRTVAAILAALAIAAGSLNAGPDVLAEFRREQRREAYEKLTKPDPIAHHYVESAPTPEPAWLLQLKAERAAETITQCDHSSDVKALESKISELESKVRHLETE